MMRRMGEPALRFAKIALATLAACIAGYFVAALLLGILPMNAGAPPPPPGSGVTIYVASDGIHTDIIVPMASAARDWRSMLAADWIPSYAVQAPFIAIGWGDRGFYLATPTWGDLQASTAIRAMTGLSGTVMHLQAVGTPIVSDRVRRVVIGAAQLQRLTEFIEASFARDPTGLPMVIASAHYNDYDTFYEARGFYSFVFTCNEWAREALWQAEMRVPIWSPFAAAIFYHLPRDG